VINVTQTPDDGRRPYYDLVRHSQRARLAADQLNRPGISEAVDDVCSALDDLARLRDVPPPRWWRP
jgi:hypothetical protein